MPLTAPQLDIIQEVQDAPDGRLEATIADDWALYAPKAVIDYELQILYTKRRAVSRVRGYWAQQVDVDAFEDAKVALSQRVKSYDALYAQVQAEIARIEAKARGRRSGATTRLTTTVPISVQDEIDRENLPPPALPDPNDPRYAGSPYEPVPRSGDFVP